MTDPLSEVRACVFDAYGTLFDVGATAMLCSDELGAEAAPLIALWRDKQVHYSWWHALQGTREDFWKITGDALDYALAALKLDHPALRERLMERFRTPPIFPEVSEMLGDVRAMGVRTAILSNGTRSMLTDAVRSADIAGLFDFVLSVEAIGVFKPHPQVYQLAMDRLGLAKEAIAFVSANSWDATAAANFGFHVVWCNRGGRRPETLPGRPEAEIDSLARLPKTLGLGTRR